MGNVSYTRSTFSSPAWAYASTSSQHAPSTYSRYTPLSTAPLLAVTSVVPVSHPAGPAGAADGGGKAGEGGSAADEYGEQSTPADTCTYSPAEQEQ